MRITTAFRAALSFTVFSFIAITCTAPLSATAEPPSEVRISGLERLYFERVTDVGPPSLHAAAVAAALPARLTGATPAAEVRDEEADPAEVSIADFPLPLAGRTSVVLREVRDTSHRIHLVWWALYADGRRQDCWSFSAFPERTEGKPLANPAIEGAQRLADGTIAVEIVASMYRPQGAEWTSAWTLRFEETPQGLVYRSAEERYGMSRGYDTGDTPPATSYWTARRVASGVERKIADDVPESLLAACHADEGDVEDVASCVTSKAKLRTATRPLDTPAFIERGGKPVE